MTSFKWMAVVSALAAAATIAAAQTKTKTSTTTITTVESEGTGTTPPAAAVAPTPLEVKESVMTAKFGSKVQSGLAGCKTEELAKSLVKDLKGDCAAWIKDQKADLKTRYLTSSCEESCEDCGTGLQRCTVTGTVRYLLTK